MPKDDVYSKKEREELKRKIGTMPSERAFVRINSDGIACIPNDSPLTQEEAVSIVANGYINYTVSGSGD